MFPVMKSASKVNGIAFCILLAVMLVYSIPKVVSFLRTQPDALALFLDGRLLRQLEMTYDREFVLRDTAIRTWADLQYLVFGEGSKGVVIGRNGWLFTNEEYMIPNDYSHAVAQHVRNIAEIEEQLRQHNKRLILMPVPMKLDIYAEYAQRRFDARTAGIYDDFVARLAEQKIETAPVRSAFLSAKDSTQLFLKTDTHWSPYGANLAAHEVARQHPELIGKAPYATQHVAQKGYHGDLLNFIQVSDWLVPWPLLGDNIPVFETISRNQSLDDAFLFDDQSESIMLVGSSYTKIDDWNFPGFLKESLQNDLLTTAVEARGPFQAMDDFLAGKQLRNDSIKTVIWEFPVRTLLAQKPSSNSWQATMNQFF
ncbi:MULTISPECIES: alginate O-acetyltransferase [unclassified Pseudomonas]|uniref:alginate O-acetyltransferase n=1 Tax=unclassified Pseudomonas TaxID=196821 RepID=UPI000BA32A44|nr:MULTISPECIES: alginate O-acetyltransferase [unclassified Pseudomonas]MDN4544651.1 alginate O-acetyltransferase [Pseudomonas sp. C32]